MCPCLILGGASITQLPDARYHCERRSPQTYAKINRKGKMDRLDKWTPWHPGVWGKIRNEGKSWMEEQCVVG